MTTKTKSVSVSEQILKQLVGAMLEQQVERDCLDDEIHNQLDEIVDERTSEVVTDFFRHLSDAMPSKQAEALRPMVERLAREAVKEFINDYRG